MNVLGASSNQKKISKYMKEIKLKTKTGIEVKDIVSISHFMDRIYVLTSEGKLYEMSIQELLELSHPKD